MAVVGSANIVVRAITQGFENDIRDAVRRAGRGGGGGGGPFGFMSEAMDDFNRSLSKFDKESIRFYRRFNRLLEVSYYLQGAIAAIVPAVGALVSGLFQLGAVAGQASAALIVLPSMLAAIGQAALTARLAFGGVIKAVQQLNKQKTTGTVDRLPSLLRNAAKALENYNKATANVAKIQSMANKAWEKASEELEDINFQAEDAALAQERAAIALERAREELVRVQDLPPNSRARREAELAFREADLSYRQAIDRNEDLTKEVEERNAAGVEGSETWLKYKEDEAKALEDQKQAYEDLKLAEKALADERKRSAAADPLANLTKSARNFALYLVSIKGKLRELKEAASEKIFDGLQKSIDNLISNKTFWDTLKQTLSDTGDALGKAALDFSKAMTEAGNMKNFKIVSATNIDTVGKFGKILGNLYSVLMQLLAAADPLIRRFTDWLVTLTDGWKAAHDTNEEMSTLTDTFNRAGDVAAQLGDIIGNIWDALMNMGKAATGPGSGGQMLLDAMERFTARFKEKTAEMLADGSLAEYFRTSAEGFKRLAKFVVKIIKIILKSAGGEGFSAFMDSLNRAVDTLGEAFGKMSEGGAMKAFGRFIEMFAEFIKNVSESGSIQVFFGVLASGFAALNAVLSNELGQKLFMFVSAAHAGRLAFGRMGKGITGVVKYLRGDFLIAKKFLKFFEDDWKKAAKASFLANVQILIVIGTIAALIAVFVILWKKSEIFRNAIKDLVDSVLKKLVSVFHEIDDAIRNNIPGVDGFSGLWERLGDVFKVIGDILGKYVIPVIKVGLIIAIDILKNLIIGIIKIIGGWIKIFQGVWDIISGIIKLFKGDFAGAWKSIKSGIGKIVSGAWQALSGLLDILFGAMKSILPKILPILGNILMAILRFVGNLFVSIGEKIVEGVQAIPGLLAQVPGFFKDVFILAKDWIVEKIGDIVGEVKKLPGRLLDLVKNIGSAALSIGKAIIGGIVDGIKALPGKLVDIVGWLGEKFLAGLKVVFNNIIADPVNAAVRKGVNLLDSALGPWINFGDPPNLIPRLAAGGVVPATNGGMLALIGEGGRNERVEPLDKDGLSKRDREMIKMLSGGGGGGVTVNVFAGPKMDEVELANIVSRQLAFEFRRGVA